MKQSTKIEIVRMLMTLIIISLFWIPFWLPDSICYKHKTTDPNIYNTYWEAMTYIVLVIKDTFVIVCTYIGISVFELETYFMKKKV